MFNPVDNYFRWSFDIVGNSVEMFSKVDGSCSRSVDYSGAARLRRCGQVDNPDIVRTLNDVFAYI